jgi:hypothetical protein
MPTILVFQLYRGVNKFYKLISSFKISNKLDITLCLFAYNGLMVSNTYCVMFCFSSSCGSYVASFSVLSISIAPSVFSNVYLLHEYLIHCYRFREKIEKRRISKWS